MCVLHSYGHWVAHLVVPDSQSLSPLENPILCWRDMCQAYMPLSDITSDPCFLPAILTCAIRKKIFSRTKWFPSLFSFTCLGKHPVKSERCLQLCHSGLHDRIQEACRSVSNMSLPIHGASVSQAGAISEALHAVWIYAVLKLQTSQ